MSTLLPDEKLLNMRYNGSFTLLEALSDKMIYESLLEEKWLPEVIKDEKSGQIFIRRESFFGLKQGNPKKICYLYFNPHGTNKTDSESSYIQIGTACKGFLMRLSAVGKNPSSLTLDYFIDIAKIHYQVETLYARYEDTVISSSYINLLNLDFNEYRNVTFDRLITEFELHKENLFREYF